MKNTGALLFVSFMGAFSFHAAAGQEAHTQIRDVSISVPADSEWTFSSDKSQRKDAEDADDFVFTGGMEATGMLQIYWQASWECEQECSAKKTLHMRFFPDEKTLLRLPLLKENKYVFKYDNGIDIRNNEWIDVFNDFPEKHIRSILKNVKNIPDNFFKYKERYVIFPATLKFSNLVIFKECDAYRSSGFFLGIIKTANTLPDQDDKLSEPLRSCGSAPYDERFFVRSKDTKKIKVKASPDIKSNTLSYLDNGQSVLKIRTVDNDWLYIKAVPGKSPYSSDTKNTAIFGYIYKSEVILSPIN